MFAILFDRPFVVFERKQKGVKAMGSRIDTLLKTFKLEERRFNNKIPNNIIKHDYNESYKILEKERKKSKEYLKKSLNVQ